MSERVTIPAAIELEYWQGREIRGSVYRNFPVDPDHTDELIIAVRSDESNDGPRPPAIRDRPQVHLAGTPRALEAFGRYLIALARLDTHDRDVHEHFEDVQNDDGGTVHLIVRRV